MKIVFVTNFFNHHQKPLAEALNLATDGAYCFMETKPMVEERLAMGWTNEHAAYVQTCYNHHVPEDENTQSCMALIHDADVVLTGSAPEHLIKPRINSGKLLFRWSERPLKKKIGPLRAFHARLRLRVQNPPGKPIYMLCSSAYTAGDFAKLGAYKMRTYKWGFFPAAKHYEDVPSLMARKDPTEILWCGRFIDWKHPDDAIRVASILKKEGYAFHLNIIGRGEMQQSLEAMVKAYDVADCVRFLGTMSAEAVREHMERAGIYLFTSDRREGWGAVLNESMNSGCGVVVSHALGAAPFLIKDGRNGLLYESGHVEMLCEKVKYLLEHPEEQCRLGEAAYHTIVDEWNAQVAAERLVRLSQCILEGETYPDLYKSGPCSRALPYKESYRDILRLTSSN